MTGRSGKELPLEPCVRLSQRGLGWALHPSRRLFELLLVLWLSPELQVILKVDAITVGGESCIGPCLAMFSSGKD